MLDLLKTCFMSSKKLFHGGRIVLSFLRLIILLNHRVVATFINIVKFGGRMRDYWSIGRSMILGISLAAAGCAFYSQSPLQPEKSEEVTTITLGLRFTVDPKGIDTDGNGIADAIRLLYHDHLTGNNY